MPARCCLMVRAMVRKGARWPRDAPSRGIKEPPTIRGRAKPHSSGGHPLRDDAGSLSYSTEWATRLDCRTQFLIGYQLLLPLRPHTLTFNPDLRFNRKTPGAIVREGLHLAPSCGWYWAVDALQDLGARLAGGRRYLFGWPGGTGHVLPDADRTVVEPATTLRYPGGVNSYIRLSPVFSASAVSSFTRG